MILRIKSKEKTRIFGTKNENKKFVYRKKK